MAVMSMHIAKYKNSGLVNWSSGRYGTSLTMRVIYNRHVNASINAEAARHNRVLLYESIFPCTSFCIGVSRNIIPIVVHTAQSKTYAISEYKSIVIAVNLAFKYMQRY